MQRDETYPRKNHNMQIETALIDLTLSGASSMLLRCRSTLITVEQRMNELAVLAAERIEQELTS